MKELINFIIPTEQFADSGGLVLVPTGNEKQQKPSAIGLPFFRWSQFTVWLKEAGILSIFNIRLKKFPVCHAVLSPVCSWTPRDARSASPQLSFTLHVFMALSDATSSCSLFPFLSFCSPSLCAFLQVSLALKLQVFWCTPTSATGLPTIISL